MSGSPFRGAAFFVVVRVRGRATADGGNRRHGSQDGQEQASSTRHGVSPLPAVCGAFWTAQAALS